MLAILQQAANSVATRSSAFGSHDAGFAVSCLVA
jgi:hypothetical protein